MSDIPTTDDPVEGGEVLPTLPYIIIPFEDLCEDDPLDILPDDDDDDEDEDWLFVGDFWDDEEES